jgi:hypothetical protein
MFSEEFLNEYAWEIDFREEFNEELQCRKDKISIKPYKDILGIAIKCGPKLNEVTEHFPAYDVALKISNHNWVPTEKQLKAIINVTAFYQTKKKFNKRYGGVF